MSSLLALLNQSAVGLNAQQAVTATANNNVANADTPGYARQVANLQAIEPALLEGNSYIGQGAELQSVTQVRDQFLEAQLPAAFSSAASASAQASTLTGLSALDPATKGGLADSLGNFYGGLQAMSQNPGDAGLRQAAVAAAQGLALAFNNTASAIAGVRSGADTQLSADVTEVNSLAAQVAKLNTAIRVARASGGQPNDLLDARQHLQDQLTQMVGISPVPNGAGDADLVLANGEALVSGDQAAVLSALPAAANGGHLSLQITLPGNATASAVPNAGVGGTIGGLLTARDGGLLTAANAIDQLAFDLGGALNTVQQAGFTAAGAAGGPLFTLPATAAGAASAIRVTAAVAANPAQLAAASSASGGSGDAGNLLKLVATESQSLSTGQTASAALAAITSSYGSTAQLAQSTETQTAAGLKNLEAMRSSASGVSTDAELLTVDSAQRVYQAISRVISATDTMLTTLMQIT